VASDSRLSLSFSALFCRPFFAQTKKGRTNIIQNAIFTRNILRNNFLYGNMPFD